MLARILAAFALITGLAAVGAPAEARLFSALSQPVDAPSSGSQQGGAQQPCPLPTSKPSLASKTEVQPGCRQRKPVIIYIPTIQFGPDRAHE
jgi:hypothetical protein